MRALAGRPRPTLIAVPGGCVPSERIHCCRNLAEGRRRCRNDSALEARVHAIVAGMTLEQKVGQMHAGRNPFDHSGRGPALLHRFRSSTAAVRGPR